MKTLAERWCAGINVSGGSLKLEKCCWCHVELEWNEGECKMVTCKDTKPQLKDEEGNLADAEKTDLTKIKEVMGIKVAFSEEDEDQCEAKKEKTEERCSKMIAMKLSLEDV